MSPYCKSLKNRQAGSKQPNRRAGRQIAQIDGGRASGSKWGTVQKMADGRVEANGARYKQIKRFRDKCEEINTNCQAIVRPAACRPKWVQKTVRIAPRKCQQTQNTDFLLIAPLKWAQQSTQHCSHQTIQENNYKHNLKSSIPIGMYKDVYCSLSTKCKYMGHGMRKPTVDNQGSNYKFGEK